MSIPTVAELRALYERHRQNYAETETELFAHIARLGDQDFRELLDRYQARQALWEDALVNYVTAIILAENVADKQTQERNVARLDALERWAYGTVRIPPPGAPDGDDSTGRG